MINVHPLLVHFPVALLTVSFVFDAIGAATKREDLLRTGWWMLLTGFGGLLFAVASGLIAESDLSLTGSPQSVLESHKQAAFGVLTCYTLVLFWRVARKRLIPKQHQWIFWVLYGGGVALMWVVAWYGGELVYRHGVPFTV